MLQATRERRLCAVCGHSHSIYTKKHINVIDAFWLSGLSAIISFQLSGEVMWSSILLSIGLCFAVEITVYLRYRLTLICRNCGFDPVLYKRDASLAQIAVTDYIKMRDQDPYFVVRSRAEHDVRRKSRRPPSKQL